MLIFDGDCSFCTSSAHWIEARLPEGYPVVPWQRHPDLEALGLSEHDVRAKAWWIDVDGTPHGGGAAIARALIAAGGAWAMAGWVMVVPPISWLAEGAYRLVARYRHRLPGGTPACRLDEPAH